VLEKMDVLVEAGLRMLTSLRKWMIRQMKKPRANYLETVTYMWHGKLGPRPLWRKRRRMMMMEEEEEEEEPQPVLNNQNSSTPCRAANPLEDLLYFQVHRAK
jgi:hypothetical protein